MYSTDSDILPILCSSLNRFVPKNVGFAKSHQIANVSCLIPIKSKSFTWKYIRMNPNANFSLKVERSRSPLISLSKLGDVQKTGVSKDMRPAFSRKFLKDWVDVDPLK